MDDVGVMLYWLVWLFLGLLVSGWLCLWVSVGCAWVVL